MSGQALSFNGAGDYVNVPNVIPFQGMEKLSVELWAYSDDVELYSLLLHKNQVFVRHDYSLQIGPHTGDKRVEFTVTSSNGQEAVAMADSLFELGRWVHVVGVYDGAEVALYVNGVKQARTGALTGSIANSNIPLRIGGAADYSYFWRGKMDDIAIYDRALSPAEIQAHYYAVTHSTPALKISGISPSSGIPGSTVTISGLSFGENSGGLSRVLFGSTAAVVSAWNDTVIEAVVPEAMTPGTYEVKVECIDADTTTISNAISFIVLPAVSSVTSSSGDGLVSVITPGVALEVSAVSTGTITSTMTVFTAMAAAGLEPVLGNFYELEPSGVQFASSATFRFAFNPVGVDTNTVAIYYFDGVTWSSASIYGQRIVIVSGTEAYVEGEILHTSLYSLLRKTPARPTPSVKVVLSPSTLNLGSNGQTITAEFNISNAGCFMGDTINISAVSGAALSSPIYAVKPGAKKDGSYGVLCGTFTVKFDRDAVAAALPENAVATVTVSGAFSDGGVFAAPAALRTIKNARNVKASEYGLSSASDQVFKLGEVYVYPDPVKGGKVPTFHLEVGTADSVKIRIYTVAGQLAHERTLAGNPQAIGGGYAYEYAWEGHIASGVYYYTVEAERSGKKIRAKGKFAVVR